MGTNKSLNEHVDSISFHKKLAGNLVSRTGRSNGRNMNKNERRKHRFW